MSDGSIAATLIPSVRLRLSSSSNVTLYALFLPRQDTRRPPIGIHLLRPRMYPLYIRSDNGYIRSTEVAHLGAS